MRRLLTLRGWPLVPQLVVAAAVAAVAAAIALGPPDPELNPGMYLLWPLWGAVLPLSFVALGRLWCALCPVTLFGERVDRAFPGRPAFPPLLARRAAILSVLALAAFHLADLWFHFEEDRGATAVLLAVLGAAALLLTAAFRGRGWCRAFCPVGGLGRMLARLSPLRIANGGAPCPRECPDTACTGDGGVRALCPVGIDLRAGIDPGSCILCGDCLKACPRLGEVGWTTLPERAPATTAAESLAALALLGLAADMGLSHLVDWPILFWKLTTGLGVAAGPWAETALHAGVVAAPPLGALLAAAVRRPRPTREAHLAALARPALALAGAALLALAARPLLVDGPLMLQGLLRGAGREGAAWLGAFRWLDGRPLRLLQEGLVAGGLLLALAGIARAGGGADEAAAAAERTAFPATLFALAAGALLLWLFSRPMLS